MASIPMIDKGKPSFAKVVAAGGKENALSFARVAAGNIIPTRDIRKPPPAGMGNLQSYIAVNSSLAANLEPRNYHKGNSVCKEGGIEATSGDTTVDSKLIDAVKPISFKNLAPSLVVNGSGTSQLSVVHKTSIPTETSSEDLFQRTDSSSDLGTKPPSIDGKSITSGTTFALDEKESLRPDDSASVKASEDDDTFSGRGSIVAGSRIGSEAAARAYRAQTYEIPDRRVMVPATEPQIQGILTPQSGSSGQQIVGEANSKPLTGPSITSEGFERFYKQTPDEKLLEALESPKDRIFLLRLEQDLVKFVKDSKEPFIDLPPCNSFCRLLTHKLADYYHMTHQYDSSTGSVRIFRTPFCRLPESLTSISNPPTTGNTPPPAVPTMKIMRRGGDGETGGSPSKATSETGSDGKDKGLSAKEKLSREEREAAYNKARERIFGNSEKTGDATPDTDDSKDVSRSSSISAVDRSGQNKRGKPAKQRRDDSENFDVRSQYTPLFQSQQQPTWAPMQQYATSNVTHLASDMQTTFPNPSPYGQFHPGMMSNNGVPPYSQMHPNLISQQFARPTPPQFPTHSAPMTAYAQTPPHQQQTQPWPPSVYQSPYQARGPIYGGPTVPYPYGQLPSTANPADLKSQHPIPGSFNRHAFNPKTQSFVPGNGGMPIQQTLPHHGSPHLQYNSFPPPQQYNNGVNYNMNRRGSNTSLPSYHASPHMATRPIMHQGMGSSSPSGSHLPHFGNISTLPPKPPPPV